MSVCLSVYLSVCLYVCVSVSVFLFLCLSFSRSLLHSVCVCIRTRVHSIECWDAEGLATTKAVQNLIDRHVGPGDRLLLFTAGTLACLATPLSLLLLIETILPACGCGRLGGCSSPLVLSMFTCRHTTACSDMSSDTRTRMHARARARARTHTHTHTHTHR